MSIMTLSDTAWQRLFGNALVINTSRIEGVAPLGVSFDLVDTVFNDDDTLMLAEFMWDFGDTGTANGTGTDDEYNVGKGYAVSHVYREVGTYTATVSAYWGAEQALATTASVTIEVSEFSGTTYYISAEGADSNDGLTELTPLLTPKYAMEDLAVTNTRILLRQGDTFEKSDAISVGGGSIGGDRVVGPIIISSYNDSLSPSDVKPIIYDNRTGASASNMISMYNCEDIRFHNFKLKASGGGVDDRVADNGYPNGFGQSGDDNSDNCLFLDCDIQGTGSRAFLWDGSYNIMQGCTVRDAGSYGIISGITYNCALIGNSMKEFANDSPEYTVRLTGHVVCTYIAYNDFWGDYTKTTFTLRGDDSSYNYIYSNQFDRAAGVNPTNDDEDQTLHHNTFDSNIVVMRDYEGNNTSGYDDNGFYVCSNDTMMRNNITHGFLVGIAFGEHAINGGCTKVWAHNNTVITYQDYCKFASVRQSCTELQFKNNIFYNFGSTSGIDSDNFISFSNVGKFSIQTDLDVFDSDYNVFMGEQWGSEASKTLINVTSGDNATLAQWQSLWGNGLHSLFQVADINTTMDTDNVLTSLASGYGTLNTGSPAIGSADPDEVYSLFDFNGNIRTTRDIGAITKGD
jgi:hypothetical protein